MLLNEKGLKATVVGLGFGGNRATGVSYICPMSLVIRDIENTTVKKVTGPVEAEQAEGSSP